jgi:hypothetical protein
MMHVVRKAFRQSSHLPLMPNIMYSQQGGNYFVGA